MKRIEKVANSIIVLILTMILFFACLVELPVYYTVSFNSDGGSFVAAQQVESGKSAFRPTDPTKADFTFVNWYNGTNVYDFSAPVISNLTLTAHWEMISANPNDSEDPPSPPNPVAPDDLPNPTIPDEPNEITEPVLLVDFTDVSADDLSYYLEGLPVNTKDAPYGFNVQNPDTSKIKSALNNNSEKYVSLKLSDFGANSIIDDNAFSNCDNLVGIIIPDGVVTIGSKAFYQCENLSGVNISASVKSIEKLAFSGCDSLTGIFIPARVIDIGEGAFCDCANLMDIKISQYNANFISVDGVLFNTDKTNIIQYSVGKNDTSYIIPNSVKSISGYAFYGCSKLVGVIIPRSVEFIGDSAFYGCVELDRIILPSSVTTLGARAFYQCKKITTVMIPDRVESIGEETFSGCSGLVSVEMAGNVMAIGDRAFSCSNLKTIKYKGSECQWNSIEKSSDWRGCSLGMVVVFNYNPDNYTEVAMSDFAAYVAGLPRNTKDNPYTIVVSNPDMHAISAALWDSYNRYVNLILCDMESSFLSYWDDSKSLVSIMIPYGVTSISFSNCYNLTDIYVSDSNQNFCSVDGVLFNKDKTALINYPRAKTAESYTVPEGVTEIYNGAFSNCINLASITIPDGVTTIGDFYGCSNLTEIVIPASVTEIYHGGDVGAFGGCDNLTSIVVDDKNINYCSIDSVLFNKDKTELIKYLSGKTDESYSIPKRVTRICGGAFYGCTNLTSVVIPDGVTEIKYRAFAGCSNLATIYYGGTENQWNSIEKGNSWNNGCPDDMTIINDYFNAKCSNCYHLINNQEIPVSDFSAYLESLPANTKDTPYKFSFSDPDISEIECDLLFNDEKYVYIILTDMVSPVSWQMNCSNLIGIEIPAGVTSLYIGYSKNLMSIVVDPRNEAYCSIDGVLFNKDKTHLIMYPAGKVDSSYIIPKEVSFIDRDAFGRCYNITNIVIQDGVTTIADNAFVSCINLNNITIPNTVTYIGRQAFAGCGLKSISIPSSVKTIGNNAFLCVYGDYDTTNGNTTLNSNFTNIFVDPANPNYCSVDGVLFNKNKTKLITYPVKKSGNSYVIPSDVITIGYYAFCDCENLTSVVIPSSVISIEEASFGGCSNLSTIYYGGTENQWNSIEKADYWNASCPDNMAIVFNYSGD